MSEAATISPAVASPRLRADAPQRYRCFDFELLSDLELPELAAAAASASSPVVAIKLGNAPATLAGGRDVAPGLQARGGEALLGIEGVGLYWVREGREIVVAPAPEASPINVRLFLLGSALGILCQQRGLLLLHANAIVAGGRAVAFAGPSGAGKSTLAAYFARAGYSVLSDDVSAIGFAEDGRPLAWPGLPRIKLWGEALARFGYQRAGLARAVEGLDKYQVSLPAPAARAVPLDRIYILPPAGEPADSGFQLLRGREAMAAVMAQSYRGHYLVGLGLGARHFRDCAALLARAEVYRVGRAWGYGYFDREAARIEAHLRSDGGDERWGAE